MANETPGPLTAMTTPARAGPAKAPTLSIVLEATFAAVSSSGVPGKRGQEGRLRRPERGAGGGGERGQRVEDRRWARRRRQPPRRRRHQRDADEVGADHDPHAVEAVAEDGGERRRDPGRQHHHERQDAERGRAARLEGEHPERDRVAPAADLRADEGELEPPQAGVAEAARRTRGPSPASLAVREVILAKA